MLPGDDGDLAGQRLFGDHPLDLGRGDILAADVGDRHFVEHRMLPGDDGDLAGQRLFGDHPLDLGRGDILAADLQHVLGPVGEAAEAVAVDGDLVAGRKESFLVERLCGRFLVAEILSEHGKAAHAADEQVAGLVRADRIARLVQDADIVFDRGLADRERPVRQMDLADEALCDGLGHAPPADRLDAEYLVGRRAADAVAHQAESMALGHVAIHQRPVHERHHAGPGAAVARRHVPEPAGRKARLDHARRARPQRGEHGIGLRVGVVDRQVGQVAVGLAQILVDGIHLGAPQAVAVQPQHRLGPRCRAGGELDGEPRHRVGRPARRIGRIAFQPCEAVIARRAAGSRRLAIVGLGHGDPAQILAGAADRGGEFRLGDRRDGAGMVGEIGHLVGGGARIGGHADGADLGAGEPGEQNLRAIVEMHQHAVAGPDSARGEAGGDAVDLMGEFAEGPDFARPVERLPDQPGLVGMAGRPGGDQRRNIEAGKGMNERRFDLAHDGTGAVGVLRDGHFETALRASSMASSG